MSDHSILAEALFERELNTTTLALLHFYACSQLGEPLSEKVECLLRFEAFGALGWMLLGLPPTMNSVYMNHFPSIPPIEEMPDIGSPASTKYILDNLDTMLASETQIRDSFFEYAEKHWVNVKRTAGGEVLEIRLRS